MRSRVLILLVPMLLVGCKSATGPAASVLQSFSLLSIDADPLTALAGPEGTSAIHATEELFEIRDDDRVKITLDYIEVIAPSGSALPERRRTEAFDFVIFGDSIRVFDTPGCVIDECTIGRGTIIGDEMLLIRPQWSGTRIFLYARNVIL